MKRTSILGIFGIFATIRYDTLTIRYDTIRYSYDTIRYDTLTIRYSYDTILTIRIVSIVVS